MQRKRNKSKWMLAVLCFCLTMRDTTGTKCSRHYWGRDGKGIITSYNYPFDYTNNLNCQHKISLDHLNTSKETEVCLTFHRFSLQDCFVGYNPWDYIELKDYVAGRYYTYQYCGVGDVHASQSVPIDLLNVWESPFCWRSTGRAEFLIDFKTNSDFYVYPGFYLEYQILQDPNQIATLKSPNEYGAPCYHPMEWTCFNRECIQTKDVCDGRKDCSDGSDETFEHARCGPNLSPRNIFACNFEENMCQFDGINQGLSRFVRTLRTNSYNRGAKYDHSLGPNSGSSNKGYYVTSQFDPILMETVITLVDYSTPLTPNKNQCLSFWYHMWGPDPGMLAVHIGGYYAQYAWSRIGSFGDEWFQGELFVPDNVINSKTVEFLVERGGDVHTQIGLDDISVRDGNCSGADISCNFELGLCGWYSTKFHGEHYEYTWKRTIGSGSKYGPRGDASLYGYGHYMAYYAEFYHKEDILITQPTTLYLEQDSKACLTFMYYTSGTSSYVTLYITQERNNGQTSTVGVRLETSNPHPSDEWRRYSLDMFVSGVIQVQFTPDFPYLPHILAIDEVALHSVGCNDIAFGMCDVGYYHCYDGACISQDLACNGRSECADGSDEIPQACCEKSNCDIDEWCCLSKSCVSYTFYCDGINHCNDWSDEDNCRDSMESQCTADFGLFACSNGYRCIVSNYVCDGNDDCGDNSDEQKCNKPPTVAIILLLIIICMISISLSVAVTYYRKTQRSNNNNANTNGDRENMDNIWNTDLYERDFPTTNTNRGRENLDTIWNNDLYERDFPTTLSRLPQPEVQQNPLYIASPEVQENPLLRPYIPCTHYTPSTEDETDLPPSYESVVNEPQVNYDNWQGLQASGGASGRSFTNGGATGYSNISLEPPPYSLPK